MKINNILKSLLICLLTTATFAFPAKAHRYHTSLTQIDYNRAGNTLEISIRLFAHDLAPLLERYAKKKIDLEKTPGVDKMLLTYLNENFILKAAGEARKIKWVGKELKNEIVWVYLEIPFEGDLSGAQMQNTIFFESFAEQTNLVILRDGEKKADLIFKVGDKVREIKLASPGE